MSELSCYCCDLEARECMYHVDVDDDETNGSINIDWLRFAVRDVVTLEE